MEAYKIGTRVSVKKGKITGKIVNVIRCIYPDNYVIYKYDIEIDSGRIKQYSHRELTIKQEDVK